MADYKVETLFKHATAGIGEGPHWEESSGKLLYVNISSNTVNRFHVETEVNEQVVLDGNASLIVPSEAGGYVVSSQRKLCHLDWDTKVVTDIAEVPTIGSNDRFNDGKCDHQGRLWTGTMAEESAPATLDLGMGRFYTLDKGNVRKADERPVDISNGLAWTADDTVMYYIDSIPRHVYAYDFDPVNGTVSNRRVAVDFGKWGPEDTGYPDGMCIDQEGKLWIAGFNSSKVMKFDPVTGERLLDINIPAKKVTSCCFGGKDYTELYVTTSSWGLKEDEMVQDPLAGSIFRVTGHGFKGLPGSNYRP